MFLTCVVWLCSLLNVFSVAGSLGVLFGLYVSVALISSGLSQLTGFSFFGLTMFNHSVISNSAAVTLMYPIAVNFALCSNSASVSYSACIYTLMLAGGNPYFLSFSLSLSQLNST